MTFQSAITKILRPLVQVDAKPATKYNIVQKIPRGNTNKESIYKHNRKQTNNHSTDEPTLIKKRTKSLGII